MSLIEDILDLAKLEAGTFSLNEEPFKIGKLIEDIDFIFGFQWAQKRIYFKVESSENLKESIFISDLGRIKQVLMNLISNSFKFTLNGGITLEINQKTIFDEQEFKRVKVLEFRVKDTGIGISEQNILQLFSMFQTFSKSKNRQYNSRGTGLGLFISKKIVESLHGNISVTSTLDEGTEIYFTIKESISKNDKVEEVKLQEEERRIMTSRSNNSISEYDESDANEVDWLNVTIPLFNSFSIHKK